MAMLYLVIRKKEKRNFDVAQFIYKYLQLYET